eukprot:1263388-Prorocentrum_lima.AAC.1
MRAAVLTRRSHAMCFAATSAPPLAKRVICSVSSYNFGSLFTAGCMVTSARATRVPLPTCAAAPEP